MNIATGLAKGRGANRGTGRVPINHPPSSARLLGKQVYWVDSSPFNPHSGFVHKRLSDGPTFSAGTACAFSCRYCYVESQVYKQTNIRALLQQTGRRFNQLVIRRRHPVSRLIAALSRRARRDDRGPTCADLLPARLQQFWLGSDRLDRRVPRYPGAASEGRVVFGSPLVDVAATEELAGETMDLCEVLLWLTGYDLRLLSKSPWLEQVAVELEARVPGAARRRLILGFSSGTLDDRVAAAIEPGPPPSRRLAALHRLQAQGFRTYGMLCPILPQADPQVFAVQAMQAIQATHCEDIWAEPMNFRGTSATLANTNQQRQRNSFQASLRALQRSGHHEMARRFQRVAEDPAAWEAYCRETFEACLAAAPRRPDGSTKLRWMQYPRNFAAITEYWRDAAEQGALLLGGIASSYRKRTAS